MPAAWSMWPATLRQWASEMAAGLRHYLVVTCAYWSFMLTDGALRMLVLLHFHALGFAPLSLALLFVLYEVAGIPANLVGGWLATRFGIARMLSVGLVLQVCGLGALAVLPSDASGVLALAWVFAAQGVAGIAKDLTKTASKSAIKILQVTSGSPSRHSAVDPAVGPAGDPVGHSRDRSMAQSIGNDRLFEWVAWLTGSKNAMKGIGFFLGGSLLGAFGFKGALGVLALLLAGVVLAVFSSLPRALGQQNASRTIRAFFARSRGLNVLAGARLLLFAARDVWFVVGVPVFLASAGWSFGQVGAFVATWTIGYGAVQAIAPRVVARSAIGLASEVRAARQWAGGAAVLTGFIALAATLGEAPAVSLVLAGLFLFGCVFAVNSALHSFLVLAYAGSEKAAEDIGFYYAANAAGRLVGTVLSGLLYQAAGLVGVLTGAAVLLAVCWLVSSMLPTHPSG